MKRVHVVAAIIYEPQNRVINNAEGSVVGRILISCRPTHAHKGGFWEFPGGKLEIGEDARVGLVRELYEELDIEVTEATPFMQISHDYQDKKSISRCMDCELFYR
jgi:8-oxo-dGTP diphosphatase